MATMRTGKDNSKRRQVSPKEHEEREELPSRFQRWVGRGAPAPPPRSKNYANPKVFVNFVGGGAPAPPPHPTPKTMKIQRFSLIL